MRRFAWWLLWLQRQLKQHQQIFKRNADLTQENIDELERQRQIENGVIKNNVKADNAKPGSDIDNSLREKYGSR